MRVLLFLFLCAATCRADTTLQLSSPLPYQVIQREGYIPAKSHAHQPGGPALGHAEIVISADQIPTAADTIQARVLPMKNVTSKGTDWVAIKGTQKANRWTGSLRVPAGGWYRLELQAIKGDKTLATGVVEPIGVGEVFLVAGQSYAGPHNDEMLKVEERLGRVVLFEPEKQTWRVAHDTLGGTIWPPTGDALMPILGVPVAFVNVSVGGTSSRQWLPSEKLFKDAAAGGKAIGRFRAVLWQQGESDVIEKTSADTYVKNIVSIRKGLCKEWGFAPPWLLAKSTLHPTVYNLPDGEAQIRAGIDALLKQEGFRPGPDTDVLDGENRGGPDSKRHFSGIGQRRAGLMWFAAILAELNRK